MTNAIRAAIIEGRRLSLGSEQDRAGYGVMGRFPANCCFGGYSNTIIGSTRFSGMEVIREKDVPVWSMAYSGGMEPGREALTEKTYAFLRKALMARVDHARLSTTVDDEFVSGRWMYRYCYDASNSRMYRLGREYICYRGRYPDFEGVDSVYDAYFVFTDLDGKGR